MENEIIDLKNESFNPSLTISPEAKSYLKESAGWGKFLAILGFVFTGLMVIMGFSMGTIFASLGQQNPFGSFVGIFYAALGLIYFLPALYLFKYSTKLKSALATNNNQELTSAFENEKSMFKFMGIFMIIVIGLYGLIAVGALLFGALS